MKLTADDATPNDYFGVSVAIDGRNAIVGAHQDDGGISTGAAYLYTPEPSSWLLAAVAASVGLRALRRRSRANA
jgi:hypothetical protein